MQQQMAQRRWDLLHEKAPYHDGTFTLWSDKPTPVCPFHYSDGVTIWVSPDDLTPDDDFLEQGLPDGGDSD